MGEYSSGEGEITPKEPLTAVSMGEVAAQIDRDGFFTVPSGARVDVGVMPNGYLAGAKPIILGTAVLPNTVEVTLCERYPEVQSFTFLPSSAQLRRETTAWEDAIAIYSDTQFQLGSEEDDLLLEPADVAMGAKSATERGLREDLLRTLFKDGGRKAMRKRKLNLENISELSLTAARRRE
jgi:hypothetical protein